MMRVGVLQQPYSPPKVVKAQNRVQTSLSDWAVTDFFSQNPKEVTAFLGRVMHDRNQIIHNIGTDTPFMDQYEKNTQALRRHIVQNSKHITGQFKSPNVVEDSRSDFIHVICDTAHTYQGRTGDAYSTLFTAANYLLEKKTSRLATDSRANMGYFLNPANAEYPIQTIYGKTAANPYAEPALVTQTFGNILFRMTPTDDIVFSPVFLHYLNTKQVYIAQIPPQQATWEALKDDEILHGLGYKKLTDRDAVAHYRWLTENASGEKFTAYLASIGDQTDATSYSWEQRKALLEDLSKQYWRLGHGSLSHPSAAVAERVSEGGAVPSHKKRRPLARPDNPRPQDSPFFTPTEKHVSRYPSQGLPGPHPYLFPEYLIQHNQHQLKVWWGLDPKRSPANSDEESGPFQWHDGALHEEGYNSSENPSRALWPLASTSSSGYSADSENNAMQPQTHRYKRRPNLSVSRPTHLEDARSQSQGEYRRLLDTSSDGASSGSENSANRVGYYGSLSHHSRKVPHRNSRAGHGQRPSYVQDPLLWNIPVHPDIHTRQDQRDTAGLWKSFQAAAPSESRKRKPEQPPMESKFRYIAPRYVERITYMEPEKIIKPLYYIPVIQKRQKDMAYKIGSFFKKLLFAIRMR